MAEISQGRVDAMRAKGMTWAAIAGAHDISVDKLRRAADPAFRRKTMARHRRRNQRQKQAMAESGVMLAGALRERGAPSRQDIEARLAEIPPDTRGLTARIMGDPLPGRSALDRVCAN
jgi:hypothetical protein